MAEDIGQRQPRSRGGRSSKRDGRGHSSGRSSAPSEPKPDPERDTIRLFVAAELPSRCVDDLAELSESMKPSARAGDLDLSWIAPENYHVTLKFLGWSRKAVLEAVKDKLGTVLENASDFELRMRGVGAFPSANKASVLWLGVERGGQELSELATQIDGCLATLGFAAETRPFVPHVTLARVRKPSDASALVLPFSDETIRGGRVQNIVLLESFSDADGTHYHRHAHWPLSTRSHR